MRFIVLIIVCLFSINSFAQKKVISKKSLGVSAGRLAFGTGDFFGYGVNVEYGHQFVKTKFARHFFFGGELSFENGSTQPKVINPTFSEFAHQLYYSTTNIVLIPKITYYPISRSFLKGINLSAGVSIGYTNQNREFQATYFFDSISQRSIRRSYLEYINQAIFGYRITLGYEYLITKHFILGVRIDFEGYTNLGDINTALVGKIGYCF